ncbi:hypothetical protein BCR34DRAFT_597990 [Clohesyomyces aquaticus]|uniref:protein S-acyltransferase n=1 Tax=Clohesyomyces aquaticus TaxID=1231657 RepID=A0A1Y2A0G4_9PLEO|nr:hypothetical protein BCR34DRAFT_597990 [Clohesyomyces aquaticus]
MTADIPPAVGMLKLPNKLQIIIASFLQPSDLRLLGRTNRSLCFFTQDYLAKYRYNDGLLALPNELMLEIVQHVGSQKDRSCLARATQRFYPLIMSYIVRYNVRNGGSGLLNYAIKRDLRQMAQYILRLGGDVNTLRGFLPGPTGKRPTPLTTAALYGHTEMVKMLLEHGANHFIDKARDPLMLAMNERHEDIVLLLSADLYTAPELGKTTKETALQWACEARLPKLKNRVAGKGGGSRQAVAKDKASTTETFPQLGLSVPAPSSQSKDIWSHFHKAQVSQTKNETNGDPTAEMGNGTNDPFKKPSKRKKWERLVI